MSGKLVSLSKHFCVILLSYSTYSVQKQEISFLNLGSGKISLTEVVCMFVPCHESHADLYVCMTVCFCDKRRPLWCVVNLCVCAVCPCASNMKRTACVDRFSLPDSRKNPAMSSLPHANFNIHEWIHGSMVTRGGHSVLRWDPPANRGWSTYCNATTTARGN